MRWLKEIKDTISKGMTWLKKVSLMIIILPNEVDVMDRVDGGDDGGGRRYFHLFSFL